MRSNGTAVGRRDARTVVVPCRARSGGGVELREYVRQPSGVAGLSLCRPQDAARRDGWSLTHDASGLKLEFAETVEGGRELAGILAQYADWTCSADELKASPNAEQIGRVLAAWRRGITYGLPASNVSAQIRRAGVSL